MYSAPMLRPLEILFHISLSRYYCINLLWVGASKAEERSNSRAGERENEIYISQAGTVCSLLSGFKWMYGRCAPHQTIYKTEKMVRNLSSQWTRFVCGSLHKRRRTQSKAIHPIRWRFQYRRTEWPNTFQTRRPIAIFWTGADTETVKKIYRKMAWKKVWKPKSTFAENRSFPTDTVPKKNINCEMHTNWRENVCFIVHTLLRHGNNKVNGIRWKNASGSVA